MPIERYKASKLWACILWFKPVIIIKSNQLMIGNGIERRCRQRRWRWCTRMIEKGKAERTKSRRDSSSDVMKEKNTNSKTISFQKSCTKIVKHWTGKAEISFHERAAYVNMYHPRSQCLGKGDEGLRCGCLCCTVLHNMSIN